MSRYDRVMQPFDLAGVEVRNRIFLPAHTTNFGVDFLPTRRHVAYLRERARTVGLVIVEPLRVHRTSLGRSGGLSGSDRRALDGLRRIVEAIREEGARAFVQITHAGRHGPNDTHGLPAWGPSAIPWVAGGEIPHAMTRAEMTEVREAYLETAGLAAEAGFEGMEVHIGHGHLLHQFLSPAANAREDDYGGSLENRLRFPLEVVEAVTREMQGIMPVGLRTSVDDVQPGALGPEEQREITARAVKVPGVAFFNASVAAYQWPSIGHHVADMAHPPHPFRDLTEALRPVIGKLPLLTANRYRTLAEAEDTLARGSIDMVGMNRAHMADPQLIDKALEGRDDQIRPCVAHNFCIGQVGAHRPISCMMNPRVGREDHWSEQPPRTMSPRRVLVIGGGPSGLEAARLAALAGHEVTLRERAVTLGGVLNVAGTGTGRSDLHRMRDWLTGAVRRAGVTLHTGSEVTPEAVAAARPDTVILACGAARSAAPLAGLPALTADRALSMPRDWEGRRVAIRDDEGSWATLSVAETLAAAGATVEIFQASTTPLWAVSLYSRMTALERLAAAGVTFRLGHVLTGGADGMLEATIPMQQRAQGFGPYDTLVHAAPGRAATALQSALEERGLHPLTIGDATAPRTLFEAMQDANRIARVL
ncbi:FAD-dependent oxidoreductase [Salipiger mucosus]|uniref:NADH:flavin oxidoreductase/NADH oxidase n=1 Tax=Salipiger mucosus DSM 16094 TaxID=1123237 RepID=S9QZM7_9RHOB|nr:FAD-dependent oxidoreductase [Salipiger mucosus]EPX85113.1 NADH:flavin oxidoreductase/NADH oxidase [Salipiger mucosus DSM 16094]